MIDFNTGALAYARRGLVRFGYKRDLRLDFLLFSRITRMSEFLSSTSTQARKTEIVIVGGCSGAILAHSLLRATRPLKLDPAEHNITLISQLPYNVWLLAAARMAVTADEHLDNTERALVPLDRLFADGAPGAFRQGKVVRMHEDHVELEDGENVHFDYVVLATGSKWPGPLNFDWTKDHEVRSHIDLWRTRIARAKRIVIVGGGPAGVGECYYALHNPHSYA